MNKVVRSASNPGVKATLRLRNRRERKKTGLFLVEGFREIRRALDAEVGMEQLWFAPELYLGEAEPGLVQRAAASGAETIQASRDAFERMAYRDRPEGLLAVCRQFDTSLERLQPSETPLVLVVEAIEKPGNLGTMIRAAAAAAADGVIVADATTDIFNPNVVRASLGTVFATRIAVCTTEEAIAWLRECGVPTFAATPDAPTELWDAELGGSAAVIVGSEQYGLSKQWLEAADNCVRIPMPGAEIDSLNAATSAAILLFEAVRQRSI